MAQLFNRGANSIAKGSLVLVVILAGGAFMVYSFVARSSYLTGKYLERDQPVQFSHRHHVGDDGIDCRYCHSNVETSAAAGVPATETCMNCHSQLFADQPYLEPVRASFRDNTPIKWRRVHDLPEFVYFDHSIHIAKGVGCASCHGDVSKMASVSQEHSLQMEWCISCHKNPAPNIRPKAEIFNTSWKPSEITAEQQNEVNDKIKTLRSRQLLTSCSTCHR
ncbi:MAG: cytochrome c3 family protein [Pyrinomonadaceae bacterium]